ncbi:hypothetical protein BDY24DRAFT_170893 [Mrakia frigida]|uniref:uncharacterized protein n=1 Tax=Mrakia frigida TaxID=29902 RepID=UPI003FCBF1D8
MLGFRLSALAWKDTQLMTSLLKQGRPHVFQFPDGTTIGGRLQEYAIVLAERLPAELEPRSSRHAFGGKEIMSIGAGGARGEEDFEALFAEEVRMDERMRAGLDGKLSAGGVGKMSWNWGLHKGGRVEVLEGEDFDPVNPSPFRRHQMKKTSRFGRYPTVEGANDESAGWASSTRTLEEERMVQPGSGVGKVEELPEGVKEVVEEWEREKGEVERRYGGELEEVAKGVWA